MLHQILTQSNAKVATIGASLGLFLGFVLLLGAWQFRCDLQQLNNQQESAFVTVSKSASLMGTTNWDGYIQPEEIDSLRAVPGVLAAAPFESNHFTASLRHPALGNGVEMFFESLPDSLLDAPKTFVWQQGQPYFPVLLSKEYLALYNFGIALGRGWPQLSPEQIQSFPLPFHLYGNEKTGTLTAKVVGFTDRVNSILVPANFLTWANTQYGNPEEAEAGFSRVFIKSNVANNPDLQQALTKLQLEAPGRLLNGATARLVELLSLVLGVLGICLVLLATLLFVLNYRMRIAEKAQDVRLLLQLGYKSGQIARILTVRWLIIAGSIIVLAFVLVWGGRQFLVQRLADWGLQLGPQIASSLPIIAGSLLVFIFLSGRWAIYKDVKKQFYA